MASKLTFSHRITLAFTLMTLLVSGIFSLGIVVVVHVVEKHLVSDQLERELDVVLAEELPLGKHPRLDIATRFYASHLPAYAMPPAFADLQPGFTELVDGDEAYYAFVRDQDGQRYMLLQEQHEFEARERTIFRVVLGGFLLSIAGAAALGLLMARYVMAPVARLAQQVQHRDQIHQHAPALAPDYAEDEVGDLASAFDKTLSQLRQTLEREQLFTSDVSHELRTPLMIIATSCEMLETGNLSARQAGQVARISRATAEMLDLVQTFLMLARSKPREDHLGGSVSLKDMAREQYSIWDPAMRAKGLRLELTGDSDSQLNVNRTLLRTVMSNLLRNAMHYSDAGTVHLRLQANGFEVQDQGIGITESDQGLLFEPFFRGDHGRGEGLGLGLSLVKRICLHQGWKISLSSTPEQGSCFRVSF
ncbi:MAG: sensor histidine kinase [Pseudomonas sp.]